ncbi:MAG: DNA methyltransferase, partial [Kiritimatiellia bacterium]
DHPLRHSAWLSFMSKRLRLAKDLLKDTGVIFMSINEDEYANLRLLSDSVFGEANYITTFTIKVRHEDRILKGDKPIHETTEFLLMYQKSAQFRIQKRAVDNSKPSEYRYAVEELIANPEKMDMGGRIVEVFQPGQYKIVEKEPAFSNLKKINIRGSIKTGHSSGRFHMTYLEPLKDKFSVLYKVPNIGDDGLGYRYFISRASAKMANGSYFQGAPLNRKDVREIPYPNYFDFEGDFNDVGTEGGVAFDGGKKPIEFIKAMLKIATAKKDVVVLDFFAGSGSTMHAVASLNEDGGNRCAIGVQNAEKTYEIKNGEMVALKGCENAFNAGFMRIVDITHKRCANAIRGYRSAKGEEHSALGGSLKYYKTDFVGKHSSAEALDEDRSALAAKAGALLAMAEETLEGEKMSAKAAKFWQHFSNGAHRHTMIYFSDDLRGFASLVAKAEQVRAKDKAAKIAVYVFAIGSVEGFENEFDDMRHITLKPIPEPILAIYKAINGD